MEKQGRRERKGEIEKKREKEKKEEGKRDIRPKFIRHDFKYNVIQIPNTHKIDANMILIYII